MWHSALSNRGLLVCGNGGGCGGLTGVLVEARARPWRGLQRSEAETGGHLRNRDLSLIRTCRPCSHLHSFPSLSAIATITLAPRLVFLHRHCDPDTSPSPSPIPSLPLNVTPTLMLSLTPTLTVTPVAPHADPSPCVTFRLVVVSLRGPGRSPVLPSACCVGSLLSFGRCGRCSCWCRFRVRGAQ